MRALAVLLVLGLGVSCRGNEREKKEEPAGVTPSAPAPAEQEAPLPAPEEDTFGSARLRVTGSWDAAGHASAVASGPGGTVRKIEMSTPPSYRRQHKKTFIVQLLFPDGFQPQLETYPIGADYRKTPGTAGGILVVHEDTITTFAAEPNGEVTFIEVGDHVRGRFRFDVHDVIGAGKQPQKTATVAGEFDALRRPNSRTQAP